MGTTAKIDFEHLLEEQKEDTIKSPTFQRKRWLNHNLLFVVGSLSLVFFIIIILFFYSIAGDSNIVEVRNRMGNLHEKYMPTQPLISRPMPKIDPPPVMFKAPITSTEGFCVGEESLCSASTTNKPAKMLSKLAEALPEGNVKRYRVKVSIVQVENE